jgi:hypothetical protein
MRVFPPTILVDEKEGFTQEKDIFARASFGDGLANLVTITDDPLVILLDSPWGTGKTTFLKMWAGELRKRDLPVIYFDAFENDHVDNGFVAIAAEVIRLSQTLEKSKAPAHKAFVKKAARLGGILLRTSARLGVKAATLGAIDAADLDALKRVANDVAKETSTAADEYVEAILKLQSQEKESLEGVRGALAALAENLGDAQEKLADGPKRPLVFIIDELDRCKPSFALELLERIKHIFSIPNVHFVLAAQLEQLANSVRYSYGSGIDALTYLQKFYNVIVHFPASSRSRHEALIPRFVSHLTQAMSLDRDALVIVRHVAEVKQLSFRTVERIATCVSLARAFVPSNSLWISPIISVLSIIKVIAPDTFRRVREGNTTIQEIKELLDFDKALNSSSINTDFIIGWWNYCLLDEDPDRSDATFEPYRHDLFRYSIDRERIVPVMAQYLDNFQSPAS